MPEAVGPAPRPRARALGVWPGTLPCGRWNAITDVSGVHVGQVTLWEGEGPLVPGQGPVRTGITVVLPHTGSLWQEPVAAASHVINGFGKPLGLAQVAELGRLESPIALTNTLNVARVADALIDDALSMAPAIGVDGPTFNPVVLECNDGFLNDIQGRHVRARHVHQALALARRPGGAGPVAEGAVGAGTGMTAFGWKAGVGTASRRVQPYTVGALVLANFGRHGELRLAGLPVAEPLPCAAPAAPPDGSVIVILAADAPLGSRALGRLARRAVVGLARTGTALDHGSGDFVLAFRGVQAVGPALDEAGPLFALLLRAAAEAVEEAVWNALFTAPTVRGRDGHTSPALPVESLLPRLKQFLQRGDA